MNRSNYSDEIEDNWHWICWRGAVESSIKGKRGQEFLKELLESLDALSQKELIADSLEKDGMFCALGSVGKARNIPMQELDVFDYKSLSKVFNISPALVREIEFINDDNIDNNERFRRVREWVKENIK